MRRGAHASGRSYFSFPEIKGHNSWLDLLRAIAVLLVLVRHGERAAVGGELSDGEGIISAIFLNGWVGVDLFLVLSGFLIGKGLLRRVQSGHIAVGTYLRARALRIIPAYYAVLFITAGGLFPGFYVDPEGMGLRVLYHMLFLQDYLPSDINVVFWSLGVEEKFYLLAPLLFFALVRFNRTRSALLLLAALFVLPTIGRTAQFLMETRAIEYTEFFNTYRSPFHYALEPLIAGVAISFMLHKGVLNLTVPRAQFALGGAALLGVIGLGSHVFMDNITLIDVSVQPIFIAALCGIAVASATALASVKVWFEPVWRVMSRLSYALYLVHFPLIPLSLFFAGTSGAAGFWVIYLGVSTLGALVLHFCVEKPFLELKTYLDKRKPKAPTPTENEATYAA